MKRNGNQLGFTLMELMIVMMIIGILVTIVAGSFMQTKVKSRDAQRKNDITQLQRSLEAYLNDHGEYPDSTGGKVMSLDWGAPFTDANGTVYMISLPNDIKAPTIQFYYHTNSTNMKYQLFTTLENAQDSDVKTFSTPPTCGTVICNYGRSSSNTTPEDTL